jgi:transposase
MTAVALLFLGSRSDFSAVKQGLLHDPVINRSYQELAEHYGVAVLAARSRKPRDKAKVEKAVQDIERWVLPPVGTVGRTRDRKAGRENPRFTYTRGVRLSHYSRH